MQDNRYNEIDALLNGLFEDLRQRFNRRLIELSTNQTAVQNLLDIQRRTLNGILDGTQKRANYSAFVKLAGFLNISTEKLIELHISQLEKKQGYINSEENKKKFIRENFDLAVLRKAQVIKDITDFETIENKITSFFGFKSIFEYKKRMFDAAFSAGAVIPKTFTTREFWLTAAKAAAIKIDNPYFYDRQELVKYFPQIRWYSTNIDTGLITVIKSLFKLGITVVILPRLSTVHLRGATFPADGQPCIVLTDYRGFYGTLWHALIHELYHVLFDWEEIKINSYHLSEDSEDTLSINSKEAEPDEFAQEYLFSETKLNDVAPYIMDVDYIKEVAKENNVDSSLIYLYYAWRNGGIDRKAWPRARRYSPDVRRPISKIEIPFDNPLDESINKLKIEVYN